MFSFVTFETIESTLELAESLRAIKIEFNEVNYKRKRNYPTLREGIRRKSITYPNKNNKRRV